MRAQVRAISPIILKQETFLFAVSQIYEYIYIFSNRVRSRSTRPQIISISRNERDFPIFP